MLAGPEEMAILGGWGGEGEPDVTSLAGRYLWDADVVVVEGWKRESLPAIEVADQAREGREPLWVPGAPDADRFLARIVRNGDGEPAAVGLEPGAPPVFRAEDPELALRLARLVEERVIPGSLLARSEEA